MQHTITETSKLHVQHCVTCGVLFALPDVLDTELRSSGRPFYCPVGHSQSYSETDAVRLERAKKRAEIAEQRAASAIEESRVAYAARDMEKRSHAHTKGELTKTKKKVARVEKGVCPHCHRSFKNLHDHMESQHGTTESKVAQMKEHANADAPSGR